MLVDMRKQAEQVTEDMFEYVIDQDFTTIRSDGEEVLLEPRGKEKKVTKANLEEYIKAVVQYRFEEFSKQM